MTEPIENADEVYRIYGNVMQVVQTWELGLALIWWRTKTPSPSGEAECKASAKAVERLATAFIKVTASQARRELGGELPDAIAGAVEKLIPDRNRLAHRFLRERQLRDGFLPGTLTWLGRAGARFDASLKEIFVELDKLGSYDGPVRPHWPDLAEKLADRLSAGEPVDLAEALQDECEGT